MWVDSNLGLCCSTISRHFTASNGWFARFQQVHHYSCQRARTVRRPIPTIKSAYIKFVFLDAIKEVFNSYPRHMIINMDEMNVGQGHEHFSSLGHRNSGARRIDCQYDNKSLLTACISITAEGYALPTLYLKKGKTPRCLERLQITQQEAGQCSLSLSCHLIAQCVFVLRAQAVRRLVGGRPQVRCCTTWSTLFSSTQRNSPACWFGMSTLRTKRTRYQTRS